MESLYRQYRKPVFTYLYGLTNNVQVAEDLTQETFLQVIRSIPSFRGDSKVTTWIFGIARNVYRKWIERNKYSSVSLESIYYELPDRNDTNIPDAMLESKEKNLLINRVISSLTEQQKELIILRDWHGLPYDNIAKIMGRSLSWVKVNIYRSRLEFRKKYKQMEGVE
ncbi:MAG: RNA polymerase sigma factor [Clostridiales bacterium]|nr:RNA polymerase sigma factor [Clostridiales bacterium]